MVKAILEVMHVWVSYFVNVETSKIDGPNIAVESSRINCAVAQTGGHSWADDQARYQNRQHFDLHNCKIFEYKDMKFRN